MSRQREISLFLLPDQLLIHLFWIDSSLFVLTSFFCFIRVCLLSALFPLLLVLAYVSFCPFLSTPHSMTALQLLLSFLPFLSASCLRFPLPRLSSDFFVPSFTHSPLHPLTDAFGFAEPPDCPSGPKVQEVESRSIVINWGHPFSGNSPLTNYIIEYREEQDRQMDGKLFKEIIESKSTSFHMQRLLPHTSYLIRVFAQNALGVSSDCRPLKVTTEREAPSSPPRSALPHPLSPLISQISPTCRDLKVTAQSSTSLLVAWKPPASEHTVTGYYVGYKLRTPAAVTVTSVAASSLSSVSGIASKSLGSERGGAVESLAYKTVEASLSDSPHKGTAGEEHCTLTGLKKHSRYQIMVQAFNSKGAGPPSDHFDAETLQFGKNRSTSDHWSL